MTVEVSDLYEKKVICPNCKTNFVTYKLRSSRLRIDYRDSDYFIAYKNEHHPMFYNPMICPKCGFASLEEKFLKPLLPVERKIIGDKVTPMEYREIIEKEMSLEKSLRRYKYCFIVARALDNSYLLLAKISHRIAWHYRMLGDEKKESEYLILARECYQNAYSKEDLQNCNMNELVLGFLIAELYYRTGEYKESVNWFSKVISNKEIKTQAGLENQAREQLHLAKEALNEVK